MAAIYSFFVVILRLARMLGVIFLVTIVTLAILKRWSLLSIGVLFLFIMISSFPWCLLPNYQTMILYGVQTRFFSISNVKELRQFGSEFTELQSLSNNITPSSLKLHKNEDLRRLGFSREYSFLNHDETTSAIQMSNTVEICWGRPLRGFLLAIDGHNVQSHDRYIYRRLHISDDVTFFVYAN
jgi:hypothetical protein